MPHASTSDDRLLAIEVETALKALGIAAGGNERSEIDLRSAVETLRGFRSVVPPTYRDAGVAPAIQPGEDSFALR